MSRKLQMNNEEVALLLRDIQCDILESRFQSDEIKISYKLSKDSRRAKLIFAPKAWIKMFGLIHEYSSEVEWHGIAERIDFSTFLIKDILIFPHVVTATTVVSDQEKYEAWLNELDDETFNELRFHGHSHVEMSTNPSSVDMEYRRKILNNFGTPTAEDDYYYIFLIGNKKHSITAQVYDLSNNALYDSDEIDISVMTGDGKYLSDFIAEAKEVVEEKKYQTTTYTGCGYQGYAKPDTKPVTTGLNAPNPNKRDGEQYDMFEELYGD